MGPVLGGHGGTVGANVGGWPHVSWGGGDTKTCVPPVPGCRELGWPPSQAWGWKGACETLKLYRV